MRKSLAVALICVLAGCASDGGSVIEKVKYDFGIGEKPEGYVSTSEIIMSRLNAVGQAEMKRMNREGRHGAIEFQDEGGLQGKYFKRVKVYENAVPLEASAVSRGSTDDRGYLGYIEYAYAMHESARKNTRAEAEAEPATIRTGETGREVYRYRFGATGAWDGAKGEPSRR
ncbi:MAG TPA: hypothetical protein PLB67_09465 [Candidatus Hydrogenedentes bacterium]|mgnify:FL=1|nr:hypothetical protein [Candidatus Hydrogenedentota bacterium]MDY0031661.1 hypothetical protein [FCB group bacterium]NLT59941.1 hypothetical protein [Candidatus Hydrogenedentota bacterium]HNV20559.1 hypothetical protein [Candidatus Hydrogenedentota bacterium]HNZ17343.1 hypothetical protein [Candidatus Hydrogenedentota bacterium]